MYLFVYNIYTQIKYLIKNLSVLGKVDSQTEKKHKIFKYVISISLNY